MLVEQIESLCEFCDGKVRLFFWDHRFFSCKVPLFEPDRNRTNAVPFHDLSPDTVSDYPNALSLVVYFN